MDEVARYLLEEAWDKQYVVEKLKQRQQQTDLRVSGKLALACEYQQQLVGDLSLWFTDETRSIAEIGWVFHPDYAGQGLATEALQAVMGLALGDYGLHRVTAQMDARNIRSALLCERVGMHKEAHLRQNWWHKGEWTDTLIYGLLASDVASAQPGPLGHLP